MTRKHSLLLDLLIVDITKSHFLDCEKIKVNLGKELIKDVIDTFESFTYEMAKGVLQNELSRSSTTPAQDLLKVKL